MNEITAIELGEWGAEKTRVLVEDRNFADRFVKFYSQSSEHVAKLTNATTREQEKFTAWNAVPNFNQWHKEIREKMGFVIVPARRVDERRGLDHNAVMALYGIFTGDEKQAQHQQNLILKN